MTAEINMPHGFRFHPTDEELVTYYLCRKCASQEISAPIIAEIDLYKFDPWELPALALYGEKEWYFFSPRDRKYPNGSRPNRAAGSGYWKATGADKPIGLPKPVAIKKALVFYAGKAPKGEKTNWIMHEYRLADVDRSAKRNGENNLRLDDWVLCCIYNKKGSLEKHTFVGAKAIEGNGSSETYEQKPNISRSQFMPPRPVPAPEIFSELADLDTPDSILKPHTDSSCSEHVFSPGFEVQSKMTEWEKSALDSTYNYLDSTMGGDFSTMFRSNNQMYPQQDMFSFSYLQNPKI